jgi:hypothetical protein
LYAVRAPTGKRLFRDLRTIFHAFSSFGVAAFDVTAFKSSSLASVK